MKNIHLVTGGNGFLGCLIARYLLEQGKRVRVLDIWDFPERSPDIEFVHCDVRDRDGVRRALQDVSVVHHNAALVPITKSGSDFASVNAEGSRLVAEEAAGAGVDAFIYMSSTGVFGVPDKFPITNDTPLQPAEIYGEAKLAGESAAAAACQKSGIPFLTIRPRTILGEGRLGIFQILFEWIRESRKIYIIGKGDVPFQFVHAHDLMDFYMLALASEKPGAYNVGAAQYGTLRQDLSELFAAVGSSSRIVSLPVAPAIWTLRLLDYLRLSPLAPYHYKTYHLPMCFDVAPLLEMGWQPRHSNRSMLLEAYRWFEENRERLHTEKMASAHRSPMREGILNLLRKLS